MEESTRDTNTASVLASSVGSFQLASTPTVRALDKSLKAHHPDGHSIEYAQPNVSPPVSNVFHPLFETKGASYPLGVKISALVERGLLNEVDSNTAPVNASLRLNFLG
tara:strand:- start:375 stop:698 length:324 start_codon:yes stop_codon:yes gene_type:complete